MTFDRRTLLATGLGVTVAAAAAAAGPREEDGAGALAAAMLPGDTGLVPDAEHDQAATLQALIDERAGRGAPVVLPPGRFRITHIELRPGTRLLGTGGMSVLEYAGGGAFLTAEQAADLALEGLVLDGGTLALDPERADALLALSGCTNVRVRAVTFHRSLLNGLSLATSSGTISDSRFTGMSQAAIRSLDAAGLDIRHNHISGCGNNGIQVWRNAEGEDGTTITGNRIEDVAARAGGSGENGNGISVFRAAGVLVSANRISDCAYSAIRGNAASNMLMTGNSCARLGEVALYAEFGFEGAVITSNLVEDAASGIEVTNFDVGGRLAVVQGNLVRRVKRREAEPVDKRGDGITVEADSLVSGNVIEDAPNAGIVVGWGAFMRNCHVAQNLIRNARFGILVSSHPDAGASLIASNMIVGAREGAIRLMDHGAPVGPDLALKGSASGRLAISGNLVA